MTRSSTPSDSGQLLLDLIPLAMQAIRTHIRSHAVPDLSVPQFRVLGYLQRHPGASLSDAASHVGLGKPAMSAQVDILVQRGLLTRLASEHDRRRLTLALSRHGLARFERARARALTLLEQRLSTLGGTQRGVVTKALRILRPLFAEPTSGKQESAPLRAGRKIRGHQSS